MTACAREFNGGVFNGELRACNEDMSAVVVNNFILTQFIQSPDSKRGRKGNLIPVYTEMFSAYVLKGDSFVSVCDSELREECEHKLARRAKQ